MRLINKTVYTIYINFIIPICYEKFLIISKYYLINTYLLMLCI